jgi:hypothetical protein
MEEIEKIIGRLAGKVLADTGTDIRRLLEQSLGRVLENEAAKGVEVKDVDPSYRHVADWLVSAVLESEHWLTRLDANGVPLKLGKFGTLQQLVDEADKAVRRRNTRFVRRDSGGEVVHSFDDGWSVVRLSTEAELDHESAQMQHCVGQGAYDAAVKAGRKSIFSLRDPSGGSHVTVEVENDDRGIPIIEEIKGKQNRIPRPDYFNRVMAWLDTLEGYEFACDDCPAGWAVDRSCKLVNLTKLPPGATFHGNVTCGFTDEDWRVVELPFPEGLVIEGTLTIYGQQNHTLVMPAGLSVSGHCSIRGMTVDTPRLPGQAVYLEDCCIDGLPERIDQSVSVATSTFGEKFADVEFGIFTSLSNCRIDTAIHKMTFKGDLDLHSVYVSSITGITTYLRVPGDMRISGSNLKLSGQIDVGGTMSFNLVTADWGGCAVTIGGDLRLHRSKVGCLPSKLAVNGSLEVSDCGSMGTLTESARIGKNVSITATDLSLGTCRAFHGDLVLARYDNALISDDIVIKGDLRLEQCGFAGLPSGMRVGRDATFSGMPNLEAIPPDFTVGRNLKITSAKIGSIPPGMEIPGNLDIRLQPSFTIPEGVRIGGSLIAWAAGIRSLPRDLRVRDVIAPESHLEALPDGFNIEGNLDISKTAIREFPDHAYVGGDVDMLDTGIEAIPDTSVVRGRVYSRSEIDPDTVKVKGYSPKIPAC